MQCTNSITELITVIYTNCSFFLFRLLNSTNAYHLVVVVVFNRFPFTQINFKCYLFLVVKKSPVRFVFFYFWFGRIDHVVIKSTHYLHHNKNAIILQ